MKTQVNSLGFYITIFGVLLLLLKLLSVPVAIGYFFIFCIILWPVTLVVSALCVMIFAFIVSQIFDWIEEKI